MIRLRNKIRKRKPSGYWTLEKCKEDALKYKSRKEWVVGSGGYYTAFKNNWLDDCCGHMEILDGNKKRAIYCVFFDGEEAVRGIYIGLTWNLKDRIITHSREDSPVFKYSKKTGLKALFYRLTPYLDVKEAQQKEIFYQKLAIEKGYKVLFSIKGGGLGGNTKYWTKDKVKKEALNYKSRSEWNKCQSHSYDLARINGWLDEFTIHMGSPRIAKPSGYWTLEKCKEDALKYKSRKEWSVKSSGGYQKARINKWLDDCCGHMIRGCKPNDYWTLEKCKEEALKYSSKTEWHKNSRGSYSCACKNRWQDQCPTQKELKLML